MSSSPFGQFSRGVHFISPSTISVEGVQWVCLDGPCDGRISPSAAKNMLALARLDDWDLDEGKPRIIDWSAMPDWYERGLHWRGWIPRGAMGGSIIPRPSKSILRHDSGFGFLKGTDVLPEVAVDAAQKLNLLRRKLVLLLVDLDILRIPIPEEVDCALIKRSCQNYKELLLILCRFCYGLLDLVGFFRWAACVFDRDIDSQNSPKIVTETYEWLNENFYGENIGYLVHLEAHRLEFGFRHCLQEDVPFYYPWQACYCDIPYFRRFNPNNLGVGSGSDKINDFTPYDQYLQDILRHDNSTVNLAGAPKRKHYVVDFEGWIRRQPRKEERVSKMGTDYYWEDRMMTDGSCARFHLLWRKKHNDSVETDEEDFRPRRVKGPEYNPLTPDIIRERYKFMCAPSEGEDIDPILYQARHASQYRMQIRPTNLSADASKPTHPIKELSTRHPQNEIAQEPPVNHTPAPMDNEHSQTLADPPQDLTSQTTNLDLDKLFDVPAISSRDLLLEIPITTGPVDDDRISLAAGEDLDRMEADGMNYWTLTPSKEAPSLNREIVVDTPLARDDQQIVEVTARPSAPTAPLAMREKMIEGGQLEESSVASLAKQLSTSALMGTDVTTLSLQVPGDPPSKKLSHKRARLPKDKLTIVPSRKPSRSIAPSAEVDAGWLSSGWASGKGKGKATEGNAKLSLVIDDSPARSSSDTWRAISSEDWISEKDLSQSSWSLAESQGGWSQANSRAVLTPTSDEWEGCSSSGWGSQPSVSKVSESSSIIGLERSSSSALSKRRRPLSPENEYQSWKRKCHIDKNPLSSNLARYREEYLTVPIPLTTIPNDASHVHPYLSMQSVDRAVWNDQYLRWAIIRFPNPRSEVKFRLWALFSNLSVPELLIRAFERHLPLALPIRAGQAFLFKKEKYSETEIRAALYYTAGFITSRVLYSADGFQLWNNYLAATADLLSRPHARGLIFKGGLVSRLVKALAPKGFFDGLLYGPSAQVTRYNKGHTNPDDNTVEDEISRYDIEVILGVVTIPGKETGVHSIWPSGRIFEEEFRGWDGEWNAACETWFLESWGRREGQAKVLSARNWKHMLNRAIVQGLPRVAAKVPSEVWSEACAKLRTDMQPIWQSNYLSELGLPVIS